MWPNLRFVSSSIKMPSLMHIVTVAVLLHDLGWVTMRPEVCLPAMIVGVSAQTLIAVSSYTEGTSAFVNQVGLFVWLIGNVTWTAGELLWDNSTPAGFLAYVRPFMNLDPKWYPIVMAIAVGVQSLTCVGIFLFYSAQWLAVAMSGENNPVRRGKETVTGARATSAYVVFPYLPLTMYYEFFTFPWIFMDTFWAWTNLFDVVGYRQRTLPYLCIVTGFAAVGIQVDCVRRRFMACDVSEAALALAELLWVSGNLSWVLYDIVLHDHLMKDTTIALFATGPTMVILSLWLANNTSHRHGTKADTPFLLDVDVVDSESGCGQVAITAPQQGYVPPASIAIQSHMLAQPCDMADAKKKRRPGHSRRVPRLGKGVTIFPKGSLRNTHIDSLKVAADSALRALGDPEESILLLDLGEVQQRLDQWRKHLPRVHPHYQVRCNGDRKVVQLLNEGRCGFDCATISEVSLVRSLGTSPEDIVFRECYKLRSHLSYVKEEGVRLMPFCEAAELQKVAAEFPAARLVLQITNEGAHAHRPMFATCGAPRDEWAPILSYAKQLRLEVVGVSIHTDNVRGDFESEHFASALINALKIFALAADMGFAMNVLDIGDITSSGAPFERVAASIEEHLSQSFPADVFTNLRIIAEVGSFFTLSAVALLTKVVVKEEVELPPSLDGSRSECADGRVALRYVLNDGLYGSFSGHVLGHDSEVIPEVIGCNGGRTYLSRFLGPGRDDFDVVLRAANVPELFEGDWLLWRRPDVRPLPTNLRDGDMPQARIWHYVEQGCLMD